MKLKRKGGLTAGIITLSAVALTSVGFAAWVISAGDTAEITGNIAVDTVSDDSHLVDGIWDASVATAASAKVTEKSLQDIKFGAPVGSAASSGKWLSNSESSVFENLTATYYVSVLNGSTAGGLTNGYVKAGFEVIEEATEGQRAVAADYSASKTYEVGDLVTYSTKVYKCVTKIETAEAWTAAKWEEQKFTFTTKTHVGFTSAKDNLHMVNLPDVSASKVTEAATITDLNTNATGVSSEAHTWFKVDIAFSWGSLWAISDHNAESAYSAGDYVKYDGNIYKCKAAITAHAFNSEEWVNKGAAGNGNPYYYYNARLSNEEINDADASANVAASIHANKYLSALDALLNGVSYKFTFKSYATTAERDADDIFVTDGLRVVAAPAVA